jgi:hypothetical protein
MHKYKEPVDTAWRQHPEKSYYKGGEPHRWARRPQNMDANWSYPVRRENAVGVAHAKSYDEYFIQSRSYTTVARDHLKLVYFLLPV